MVARARGLVVADPCVGGRGARVVDRRLGGGGSVCAQPPGRRVVELEAELALSPALSSHGGSPLSAAPVTLCRAACAHRGHSSIAWAAVLAEVRAAGPGLGALPALGAGHGVLGRTLLLATVSTAVVVAADDRERVGRSRVRAVDSRPGGRARAGRRRVCAHAETRGRVGPARRARLSRGARHPPRCRRARVRGQDRRSDSTSPHPIEGCAASPSRRGGSGGAALAPPRFSTPADRRRSVFVCWVKGSENEDL